MNKSKSLKMLQTVDLEESSERSDSSNENLSVNNIQKFIKQEECDDEDVLPIEDYRVENNTENLIISQPKSKKSTVAKRSRLQKSSKRFKIKKKLRKLSATHSGDDVSRELLKDIKAEMAEAATDPTESRTVYTCKFCKKDFFSSFILCLHVQIHEKVNSVSSSNEENISLVDSLLTSNDVAKENMNEISKSIKLESIEDSSSDSSVKKSESVGIINKNFVASLKKNLSLAMNRNL